jgi:hypothetical protein
MEWLEGWQTAGMWMSVAAVGFSLDVLRAVRRTVYGIRPYKDGEHTVTASP